MPIGDIDSLTGYFPFPLKQVNRNWPKLILLAILVVAILVGAWVLLGTETGRGFLHNPHHKGRAFRTWVAGHRVIAPLVFVAAFVTLGSLALPVWWLQILAGY